MKSWKGKRPEKGENQFWKSFCLDLIKTPRAANEGNFLYIFIKKICMSVYTSFAQAC